MGLLSMRTVWIALGANCVNRGDGIGECVNDGGVSWNEVRSGECAGLPAVGCNAVGETKEATSQKEGIAKTSRTDFRTPKRIWI